VKSSHNASALFLVSALALVANVGVLVYEIYKIARTGRNPFEKEMYSDLATYKKVLSADE
jgi:hypothetical protein